MLSPFLTVTWWYNGPWILFSGRLQLLSKVTNRWFSVSEKLEIIHRCFYCYCRIKQSPFGVCHSSIYSNKWSSIGYLVYLFDSLILYTFPLLWLMFNEFLDSHICSFILTFFPSPYAKSEFSNLFNDSQKITFFWRT